MTNAVQRVLRPFQQFAATESASGVLLLIATAAALVLANSPWSYAFTTVWTERLVVSAGPWSFGMSLAHWINDGLMAVFFLLVGLEIKRELLIGELASPRKALLPAIAALGGVVVPASIYVAITAGTPAVRGWAIPVATDIAFAIGILTLLGSRVPPALTVFLTALAIVDDIIAVGVIAFFYSSGISVAALAWAAVILAVLIAVNGVGIRHLAVYLVLGALLWVATLSSGLHPTIAGVALAATIPGNTRVDEPRFVELADEALFAFKSWWTPGVTRRLNPGQEEALHGLHHALADIQSPLIVLEHRLHAAVAFGILPLFALANAGVALTEDALRGLDWRIAGAIAAGLCIGKPLGIMGATYLVAGDSSRPLLDVTWRALRGASVLGGIGFTMSLFIAALAFQSGPSLESAKVGILAGSLLSGVTGYWLVRSATVPRATFADAEVIPFRSRRK